MPKNSTKHTGAVLVCLSEVWAGVNDIHTCARSYINSVHSLAAEEFLRHSCLSVALRAISYTAEKFPSNLTETFQWGRESLPLSFHFLSLLCQAIKSKKNTQSKYYWTSLCLKMIKKNTSFKIYHILLISVNEVYTG